MSAEAIENCRYCLMCRHAAPVGHVMRNETVSPHGIALVAASVHRGQLDWNPSTIRVLYAEPDTGNCRAHCVTDQRLPAAIAAVRAKVSEAGLAPEAVYRVHERLQRSGSAFGSRADVQETGEVALFVGDEAHNLWPSAADAALQLLELAGIKAVPIGRGTSSGYLACSLGFPATARRHAEACIAMARAAAASTVLVLSPGDLFTFQQLYPERLQCTWPENIELVDVASFLAGRLHVAEGLKGEVEAAYVDPTHAVRTPERFEPVRKLCRMALGRAPRELFWRRERAHPVGSTAVQYARPDIAEALTQARLKDARNTGATKVICEDAATLHQLSRYADGYGLEVLGLFEELVAVLQD